MIDIVSSNLNVTDQIYELIEFARTLESDYFDANKDIFDMHDELDEVVIKLRELIELEEVEEDAEFIDKIYENYDDLLGDVASTVNYYLKPAYNIIIPDHGDIRLVNTNELAESDRIMFGVI